MRILVLDVAASASGAVTVLKEYYQKALLDKGNRYYFCISIVPLESKQNINVLSFPWVKKSWFHRLYFDYIVIHKYIKKYKIGKILSLQNLTIPFCDLPQTIYLHQSLPFSEHRFSILQEPKLWVYQNIIGRMIFHSLRIADTIVVQTNWMKVAVVKKIALKEDRVLVIPPKVDLPVNKYFDIKKYQNRFFYPATGFGYKNHIAIYKAVQVLKKKGITNFKVALTLTEENLPGECRILHEELKDNFELLGTLEYEQVIEEYCKSVVLFPSYIETVGLPLIEAYTCGCYIVAADEPFSREILGEYGKVKFFLYSDFEKLANIMRGFVK